MNSKTSILGSIISGTCPRCHGDQMYVNSNPYVITQTMQMHEQCGKCGLKYSIEPNFFFGAMFVSYGLAVFVGILIFAISFLVLKTALDTAFIAILIGLILLMPIITRLSRNIYIAMFVRYRPDLEK